MQNENSSRTTVPKDNEALFNSVLDQKSEPSAMLQSNIDLTHRSVFIANPAIGAVPVARVDIAGGRTLQIPIRRPEVLIDNEDNAMVICRGDLNDDRMAIICLSAPLYAVTDSSLQMLSEQTLGFAEPLLDCEGLRKNQKFTLLIQHNKQLNHNANSVFISSAMCLCEFEQ